MLMAGVGKTVITPKVGAMLYGYTHPTRNNPSIGVHDDLHARAVVLQTRGFSLALCSVELCYLRAQDVAQIRQRVSAQCGLFGQDIFIATTHTHSGPATHIESEWDFSLIDRIAEAILIAYNHRQPARFGSGIGLLHHWHINRRWLDRPVDPALGVLRIETLDNKPLAVMGSFGCHAVVMGADNLFISGDYPGYFSRIIEKTLANNSVALFFPGGAGDANPMTSVVRARLTQGNPIGTLGDLVDYYGKFQEGKRDHWNIGDRAGGTFSEAEELGQAVADEVLRVYQAIVTAEQVRVWTDRIVVNGKADPSEPYFPGTLTPDFLQLLPELENNQLPLEIMLVGIGDSVLVGHPGETFSENAVQLRIAAQQMGYKHPLLITYANGNYAYLPPAYVWDEGGYEISAWVSFFGISRQVQERIWNAIAPILKQRKP